MAKFINLMNNASKKSSFIAGGIMVAFFSSPIVLFAVIGLGVGDEMAYPFLILSIILITIAAFCFEQKR